MRQSYAKGERMSWPKRVLLAAVSGVSTWPVHYVLDWLSGAWEVLDSPYATYVPIGAVFGALVLVPFLPAWRQRIGSVAALVLGSIVIYGLAVQLAFEQYGPLDLEYETSIVVSGLLGALLVGVLAKVAVPLRTSVWSWAAVAGAGLIGGIVFSWAWSEGGDASIVVGYVVWQVLVCLALGIGRTTGSGEMGSLR